MMSSPSIAKPEILRFVVTARRAVLVKLVSGVMRGAPLLALTGPHGTGKTTMASAIQEVLVHKSVRVLRVGLAELSGIPLRAAICQLRDKDELSGVATTRSASDQRFVAIIDDAHLLPPDALGHLRLLIGRAMGATPQTVFVGGPSFWDTMQDRSHADPRDLITDRCELELLSADETRALAALSASTSGFGEGALDALVRHGHGLIGRTISLVSAAEAARGERQPPMLTAARVAAAAAWLDAGGAAVTSDARYEPRADEVTAWGEAQSDDLADVDIAEAAPPSRPWLSLGRVLGTTAVLSTLGVGAYWQMSLHGDPIGARAGSVPETRMAMVTAPSAAGMSAAVSGAAHEADAQLEPAEAARRQTDPLLVQAVAPVPAVLTALDVRVAEADTSGPSLDSPAAGRVPQQEPSVPSVPAVPTVTPSSDPATATLLSLGQAGQLEPTGARPSEHPVAGDGVMPPALPGDPVANMDRTEAAPHAPVSTVIAAPDVPTTPVAPTIIERAPVPAAAPPLPASQDSEPDPAGARSPDRSVGGDGAVTPALPEVPAVQTGRTDDGADVSTPAGIAQPIAPAPTTAASQPPLEPPSADKSDAVGGPVPPAVAVVPPVSPTAAAPSVTAPKAIPAASGSPRYQPPNLPRLLARGDAMMALGDISAARLLYERAASLGSARAATSLGRTYDPDFLATIRASGITPNRDTAAAWYRKAAALGDADGSDRQAKLTLPR